MANQLTLEVKLNPVINQADIKNVEALFKDVKIAPAQTREWTDVFKKIENDASTSGKTIGEQLGKGLAGSAAVGANVGKQISNNVTNGLKDLPNSGAQIGKQLSDEIGKGVDNIAAKGKDVGKQLGNEIGKGLNDIPAKADGPLKLLANKFDSIGLNVKNIFSGALGVFGGGILTSGIQGIVTGFQDIMSAGMEATEDIHAMEMAFAQAGLSGQELSNAVSETNDYIGQLQEKYAMADDELERYSQLAASIGGATGKTNQELVQLAIGIEKASGGLVDGTAAIKLFSRGVTDPETEFAMGKLTKQFPALATELKGLKDPAEATQKALQFFGPTFTKMEEAANGPLGASQKMANAMKNLRESIGTVLVNAFYPIVDFLGQRILPAISKATQGFGSLLQYVKPLSPVFITAGVAIAGVATSLLALKGVQAFAGMTRDAIQFGLSITQKVIPALVAQNATTGLLLLNKNALTLSTIKDTAATWLSTAAKSAYNLVTGIATALTAAFNTTLLGMPIGWIVAAIGALVAGFILLYKNVDAFAKFFDKVWVGIKAVVMAYWEYVKGIFTAVYKLFTGDFSGAWKAVTGIGKNMADAFNSEWKSGMDKVEWDYAKKKMDESLKKGKEINVQVNLNQNNEQLLQWYESTQAAINKLQLKKESGIILTGDEEAQLAKLTKDAQYMASQLGAIAPAAKENFKVVVDETGKLKETWDINISKAKEYIKTNDGQGELKKATKDYSDSLIVQANIVEKNNKLQKEKLESIQKETNPLIRQELLKKYNEENKAITKNKDELIKSFTEGAAAGIVNEKAINNVAKALGTTSEEARKMLLSDALKKAAKDGVVTQSEIEKIAKLYGVSTDKVKAMVTQQEKLTKEMKATTMAAMSLSDAVSEAQRLQNDGRNEAILAQYLLNNNKITQQEYNDKLEAAKKKIQEGIEFQKAFNQAAEQQRETGLDNLYIEDLTARTKKEKEKSSAKEKKSIFDILELTKQRLDAEQQTYEQNKLNATASGTELEKQKANLDILNNKIANVKTLNTVLNDLMTKSNVKVDLNGQLTFPDKMTADERNKLNQYWATFQKELREGEDNKLQLEAVINVNPVQVEAAKLEVERQMQKNLLVTAEIQFANGELDLTQYLSAQNSVYEQSKNTMLSQIENLNQQIILGYSSTGEKLTLDAIEKLKANQLQLQQEISDTTTKVTENDFKIYVENETQKINLIQNRYDRELELAKLNAKLKLEQDLASAKGSQSAIEASYKEFWDKMLQLELDRQRNQLGKVSQLLIDTFTSINNTLQNITIDPVNFDDINKKYKEDSSALKKSLINNQLTYEDYVQKLNELDKKRNDDVKKSYKSTTTIIKDALKSSLSDVIKTSKEQLTSIGNDLKNSSQKIKDNEKQLAELKTKLIQTNGKDYENLKTQIQTLSTESARNEQKLQEAAIKTGTILTATFINLKNAGASNMKALVMSSLSALRAFVPVAIGYAYSAEIISKSWLGLATGAILAAALTTILVAAENAVASANFKKGGVNIKGRGNGESDEIPANISRGESVITAKATARNIGVLEYLNKTGDDALNYYLKFEPKKVLQSLDKLDYRILKNINYVNSSVINMDNAGVEQRLDRIEKAVIQSNYARKTTNKFDIAILPDREGIVKAVEIEKVNRLRSY